MDLLDYVLVGMSPEMSGTVIAIGAALIGSIVFKN